MAAIVDLIDDSIVEPFVSLPHRMILPDGGTTIFVEIGQAEPAHSPRYKAVATQEVVPAPDYPYIETDVAREFADGKVVVTRTFAPDQAAYQQAIEDHILQVAAQRGYSSAVSLASYVTSVIPLWQAEAQTFVAWRDSVWIYALSELVKVQNGQREIPTLAALIAELPVITWPEVE
ncbi:hypothetical protein [Pseudorhodoplanes sp.]|uniref:hypothetical protein n=1 Tax=Pseudorhodoplanes sp. TaxID=1934341 RepID=UPI002BF52E10|nr:hypothetical protein [Pseudorhodoplanes sp.]HWV44140.1 hypothetical protein [Pseudorhodoplanes sp.]